MSANYTDLMVPTADPTLGRAVAAWEVAEQQLVMPALALTNAAIALRKAIRWHAEAPDDLVAQRDLRDALDAFDNAEVTDRYARAGWTVAANVVRHAVWRRLHQCARCGSVMAEWRDDIDTHACDRCADWYSEGGE